MARKKAGNKGHGSIDQRGPNGLFRVRITISGKLHSKSFSTQTAAADWLHAVRADHGRFDRPAWALEAKSKTLGDVLNERLEHIAAAKNIRNEKYAVGRLEKDFPELLGKSIYDVDAIDIRQFIKKRRSVQGAAVATVNRDLSVLSHAFNLAATTFGCTHARNPIQPTTRLKLPRGRVRRISAEEEAALLEAAREYEINSDVRISSIIRFACDTAMRCGEITGMQWEHVDLMQGTVFLPDTKNGDSRSVPLWLAMRALLRDLGPQKAGPVWSAHEAVRSAWRRVRAAAIVTAESYGNRVLAASLRDLRFHDFRHEGTSRLIERTGWENSKIMAVTGHKTSAMLARYSHLRSSTLASQMAVLEGGNAGLHLVEPAKPIENEGLLPKSPRARAAWQAVSSNAALLTALVAVRPIRDIAADFGVSDVAVHKACAKLGIEKKPRGFWLSDAARAA